MSCTCGLPGPLADCCGRYLEGFATAPTAAALMRSRYTAYVHGHIDYLMQTHAGEARREEVEAWSRTARWDGLEVLATEAGEADDTEGMVEFVARYRIDGQAQTHHERSLFRRIEGRWYYISALPINRDTSEFARTGRNEPCPCGSGRKYKKCCLP